MSNPRLSWEEFNTLFPGPFKSQEEMQREYRSFLLVLQQLDGAPVPELSARERAEIFRRSWAEPSRGRSMVWTWVAFLRRPAVTFALGLVLGCILMFTCMRDRPDLPQSTVAERAFTVERIGHTQTYGGTVLQALYPQIENPKMVVEKTQESSPPQRVLHGTLDNGKINVLWNL